MSVELRTMPKVELHCHLEATLDPVLVTDLAEQHNRPDLLAQALPAYNPDQDFAAYLRGYDAGARLLRTADDFTRATTEHLVRAHAESVRYTELFWSPMVHLDDNVSYATQLKAIGAAVEDVQDHLGLICRLVPAIDRSRPVGEASALLDEILDHPHDLVVGLGLDYDELLGPAPTFAPVFARAARAGLATTSHAGETAGSTSVLASIDDLGCRRIDHGYAILDDDDAVERCREAGIVFTVSSRAADLLSVWGVPPVARPVDLWRAGLRISPTTDAPAHFGTTLTDEFESLAALGCSTSDLGRMVLDGVDASFLPLDERAALRTRLVHELEPTLKGDLHQ